MEPGFIDSRLLSVLENEHEYRVVFEDDKEDYVAIFEKSWPEAKDWAYNMMNVHNSRLTGGIVI